MNALRRKIALLIWPDCGRDQRFYVFATERQVADLIRRLSEGRGWKISHASKMASGNGDTVARIERGIGMTMRRANQIVARVSALWPADLEWPSDIPRPRSEEDAA